MQNRIRELAKQGNIKLSSLSKNLKMSRSHLYYIISGEYVPSLRIARKIAKGLKCTVEEVFPESEEFDM